MSLSLSQIVLPAYQQTLPAVINILEKGSAHFAEARRNADDIVGLNIIDDMLPMHFQIVSVVHHFRDLQNGPEPNAVYDHALLPQLFIA